MEDLTASMSYFAAAASKAKALSLEEGISGGTGYSIETRLSKVSASSDGCTTGGAFGTAPLRGCGRENMALMKDDDAISTDLWT